MDTAVVVAVAEVVEDTPANMSAPGADIWVAQVAEREAGQKAVAAPAVERVVGTVDTAQVAGRTAEVAHYTPAVTGAVIRLGVAALAGLASFLKAGWHHRLGIVAS